jgi:hypothetical protein
MSGWEEAFFGAAAANGSRPYHGWAWHNWGIHYASRKRYVVIHLPSAQRITEFDSLRITRRFCEEIDRLADCSIIPANAREFNLQMHRIALQLTSVRPATLRYRINS